MTENREINDPERIETIKVNMSGISLLQDWVRDYMRTEPRKDPEYRANIVTYELGDLIKQMVYLKAYGPSRWDRMMAETALGDLLMMVFCLADILDIDIYRSIAGGLDKLANKEWKKKS